MCCLLQAIPPAIRAELRAGNFHLLQRAGERFLDVICRDATQANDAWKAVVSFLPGDRAIVDNFLQALALLNVLVASEARPDMLTFLSRRGYLRNLLDDLGAADTLLRGAVGSRRCCVAVLALGTYDCVAAESMKQLHVFEAKMQLLLRMCEHVSRSLVVLTVILRLRQGRGNADFVRRGCTLAVVRLSLYRPPTRG